MINKRVHIITTTAIKGVSDVGHVAIYPTMNSNIACLLDKQDLIPDDSLLTVLFSGEPIPASDIPLFTVPYVQQFKPEPAPAPVTAATPVVQTVPVSSPSVVAPASSDSSIIPTAVSLSTPAAEPSISADAHIDPVSPLSIPDPVPTPTSTTSPASPTAPVVPTSSSPRAKKSGQVSVRFATQPVDTELERLRKVNRVRRQKLTDDMNSRVTEPLLFSASLASSSELLAYSAVLLQSPSQSAYFVDWSTHTDDADAFYFSFQDNAYIQIISEPLPDATSIPAVSSLIEAFRAITENVPKTFLQALRDPVFPQAPARLEFDIILTTTKSLVRMDTAAYPTGCRSSLQDPCV